MELEVVYDIALFYFKTFNSYTSSVKEFMENKVMSLCLTKYYTMRHIHHISTSHEDILGQWRYSYMHS
jgi:hypothetical protein